MRYFLIIFLAKLTGIVTRITHAGSGSALPGLFAEKLAPGLLGFFSGQIPNIILITGTNGKTTTQTILGNIFRSAGKKFLANSSGSNLKRGLLATFIQNCSLTGRLDYEYAILEIEEATIPKIIKLLHPRIVIVTNLYRDQLDAYGEVDRTQNFIRKALQLSAKLKVILNSDDPRVINLADGLDHEQIFYSLGSKYKQQFAYEGKQTAGTAAAYLAENITINDDLSSTFSVRGQNYSLKSPGLFHIYNCLAAIAAADVFHISSQQIRQAVAGSLPAFGRGEEIGMGDISYKILLVKNPAGATLTLNMLSRFQGISLCLLLNDKLADGRDVSWIWDAEFELLQIIKPKVIMISGMRAEDMLLRVKYALEGLVKTGKDEFFSKKYGTRVILHKDTASLHQAVQLYSEYFHPGKGNASKKFYVLPTYTAMLEFRKALVGKALI